LGQGIEITETHASTDLGFTDSRTCKILQSESMYDFGNTFRILVTDRPLIGKFKMVQGAADPGVAAVRAGGVGAANGDASNDWLNSAPAIMDELFDQVDRFRKTFVQVPGCEQSTAERIREMNDEAKKRLIRHHKIKQTSVQLQVEYQVSRNVYAALHSFVFPHLQRILASAEERLEKAIRSYASQKELVEVEGIFGPSSRALALVDVRGCAEQLADMDHKITPHEKVACIDEAHSVLQRCVAESARNAPRGGVEITGDDVLSLFILAVHGSGLKYRLAHTAHVEMYLQGAAGRNGSMEAARFEEAGYAVTAFQSALQFFLGERRHVGSASRGAPRATTNVFSSYLQQGPAAETDTDAGMGMLRQGRR